MTASAQNWASLRRRFDLTLTLARRDVASRYRGSMLGVFWSVLTPMLMLAVFTFVFGTVFQARWSGSDASTAEFALLLFCGLVVFALFQETVARAPGIIISNVNYVKKVVFPLEVLPIAAMGSILFHAGVSFVVLLAGVWIVKGAPPATALWLPLVLAPFILLNVGLSWILASLGVYFRDVAQVVGTMTTALLFLSPVFYPSSSLPETIRPYLQLNPVAFPVEQVRDVVFWGVHPDFTGLFFYTLVAALIFAGGWAWFQATRKGFADVL